ncbi:sialin, partial [Mytilus galloprovincialis]
MEKEEKTSSPFIESSEIKERENVPCCCSQRWILAYTAFFGFLLVYALRVNISVGIVCMVRINDTSVSSSQNNTDLTCVLETTKREYDRAEFDWDKNLRSTILASFFYGYIVTQIPAGWFSDKFGGKRVFGVSMAISGLATVLLPVCARTSVILVYVMRVIVGLGTGTVFPALQSMWGRWAPPLESSKLVSVGYMGTMFGTTITFATSGVLCQYGFDNGWGSIFYLTGGLTFIWVIAWFILTADTPAEHPRITEAEKNYIESSIEYDTHIRNGALSAVPYICQAFGAFGGGQLADMLRSRGILSTTAARRLFELIAFFGTGGCLVITGFITCDDRQYAVVCLALAVGFSGLVRAGHIVNHVDFAPKYAGIMFGITNTFATIPGMIAPIVAGALTPNNTQEEWRNVFYVCAGFTVFGAIIFATFVSGEVQDWARDRNDPPKEEQMRRASSFIVPTPSRIG